MTLYNLRNSAQLFSLAVCFVLFALPSVSPSMIVNDDFDPSIYCMEPGLMKNPHDPTNRTFIRCKLAHEKYECSEGFQFSEEKAHCIENPDPIDHSIIDWHKVLQCPPDAIDHYYRNPYDCSRFFRCYLQGENVRLDTNDCHDGMYFDEEFLTCIPVSYYIERHGQCHPKSLPNDLSFVDWSKVLKCPSDVVDKYLRNPYDCTRFYRCYKQGTIARIDPMHCLSTMYFDETMSTCLPIVAYQALNGECHARMLPRENEDFEKERKYWEEQDRLKKEKEQEKLKQLELERLEEERLERERLEAQQEEIESLERERMELEELEREQRQQERDQLEHLVKVQEESERLQLEKERLIQQELEQHRTAAELMEQLHQQVDKLEQEKHQLELELNHRTHNNSVTDNQ